MATATVKEATVTGESPSRAGSGQGHDGEVPNIGKNWRRHETHIHGSLGESILQRRFGEFSVGTFQKVTGSKIEETNGSIH